MNLSHALIKIATRAMLMLGLAASGIAWAQCAVTLASADSVQATFNANCGGVSITNIEWFQDATSLGNTLLNTATTGLISNTIIRKSGTYLYTACGNNTGTTGCTAVAKGVGATLTTAQPYLTVAVSGTGGATGTVSSTPAGTPALNCPTNCTSSYTMGTAVTLTAAGNAGFSFAGWSGDCSGTGSCIIAMTGPRTVIATFSSAPANGACGMASNGSAITTAPSTNLCASGTATAVATPTGSPWNFTWGCNGVSGGTSTSATACSVPWQFSGVCGNGGGTPQSSTPTANLCNAGTASTVTATIASPYTFNWTCAGANGGATSPQCSVAQQQTVGVCANIVNTLIAPTTNGCTAGTVTGMTNTSNTFTWTCAGLAGGASSGTCSANQTIAAACGVSNGGTFSSAPSTNLCAAGNTASAVSGTGPWTWSCNGVNPASSASCSATLAPATTSCTVVDATAWLPGNVSDLGRLVNSTGGVVVSYKFTAAQLITGAPSKQGKLEFSETTPGPQFEISNQPCDMTMPLPAPNNATSFLTCARVGAAANRFPTLTYMAQDNPNNPAWGAYGYCGIVAPDAGSFYYVNVQMPASCGSNCTYFLWYYKQ